MRPANATCLSLPVSMETKRTLDRGENLRTLRIFFDATLQPQISQRALSPCGTSHSLLRFRSARGSVVPSGKKKSDDAPRKYGAGQAYQRQGQHFPFLSGRFIVCRSAAVWESFYTLGCLRALSSPPFFFIFFFFAACLQASMDVGHDRAVCPCGARAGGRRWGRRRAGESL